MKHWIFGIVLMWSLPLVAQGPPITLDKPIMLGAKKGSMRAYFKMVGTDLLDFQTVVLDGDYNVTSWLSVGAEVPLILGSNASSRFVGDMSVMVKGQFVRLDRVGKSLRIAAKAKQGIATGRALETNILGMGHHMTYGGFVAAYESLHLGVQAEAGGAVMYGAPHLNHLNYKLGVGLPILKPTYPVKQVTFYLETEGQNFRAHHGDAQYGYYAAPGVQFARKRFTFDLSYQFPFAQQLQASLSRRYAGLAGMRVIL